MRSKAVGTIVGLAVFAMVTGAAFSQQIDIDPKSAEGQCPNGTAFKIDSPSADGVFGPITLTGYTPTGFSWSSTVPVNAVLVKAGSDVSTDGQAYVENPGGTSGQAQSNGKDISHIIFCLAGSAPASNDPGCIHGTLIDQEKSPLPDGVVVKVTADGKETKTVATGGRFDVPLPPSTGNVAIEIQDCAGKKLAGGTIPPAKPGDKVRVAKGDLGAIPVKLVYPARSASVVVLTGHILDFYGQPVADGTEIAFGLKAAGLFDSTKTKDSRFSLALLDVANKTKGGFKAANVLEVAGRLPNGTKIVLTPATVKLTNGMMANGMVARDLVFKLPKNVSKAPAPPAAPVCQRASMEAEALAATKTRLGQKYPKRLNQYNSMVLTDPTLLSANAKLAPFVKDPLKAVIIHARHPESGDEEFFVYTCTAGKTAFATSALRGIDTN